MQPALKRSELKEHIAKVAAELFYSEGITAVGVDRIADVAQVTKRTIYHHFSSKDDLIAAALRVAPTIRLSSRWLTDRAHYRGFHNDEPIPKRHQLSWVPLYHLHG